MATPRASDTKSLDRMSYGIAGVLVFFAPLTAAVYNQSILIGLVNFIIFLVLILAILGWYVVTFIPPEVAVAGLQGVGTVLAAAVCLCLLGAITYAKMEFDEARARAFPT